MLGPAPQVTPLCVRSAGVVPEPLPVQADADDIEALLGKPLAHAMTSADLELGDFIDGQCAEPAA